MKKIFLGIVIGIILSSGVVYAFNYYRATDVQYTTTTGNKITVNDALDDLYIIKNLGDAEASDISEGKTAVVQGKEITGTYKTPTYIRKEIAYFSGTTNAGGVITKRIYASDLGMSKIIGLTKGSIEENIKTPGHFLSIEPSADGSYADLTCYMSYGGQTVKCGATIVGLSE